MKIGLVLVLALAVTSTIPSLAVEPLRIGQGVEIVADHIKMACPNESSTVEWWDNVLTTRDGDDKGGGIRRLDWDSKIAREYRERHKCRFFNGGDTGFVRATSSTHATWVCVAPTTIVGDDGYLKAVMPMASDPCYWFSSLELKTCKTVRPTIAAIGYRLKDELAWWACVK